MEFPTMSLKNVSGCLNYYIYKWIQKIMTIEKIISSAMPLRARLRRTIDKIFIDIFCQLGQLMPRWWAST